MFLWLHLGRQNSRVEALNKVKIIVQMQYRLAKYRLNITGRNSTPVALLAT